MHTLDEAAGVRSTGSDPPAVPRPAVLIVDTPPRASALASRLEAASMRVVVETTFEGAQTTLAEEDFDCVVSEYGLPTESMDGIQFLERVRQMDGTESLPFVMWTDGGTEQVASAAIAAGVTDYVLKTTDGGSGQTEYDATSTTDPSIVGRIRRAIDGSGEPDRTSDWRQFEAVFEKAFDAMLIVDDDREYVDVNPAACDLFGLPREELIGRTIDQFAADGFDVEYFWQSFRESSDLRGTFPLERPDGERRIVEFGATYDILSGRHLSIIRDITEHRRLREQRDEVFGRISDAFYALDDEFRFTYVNGHAEELLGRSGTTLEGTVGWEAFSGSNRLVYEPALRRAMETQESVSYEEYADTIHAWVEVRIYPSASGLSVYLREVTDRKARERELARFRRAVEASGHAIYMTDTDGRITYVNSMFEELTGYQGAEVIGMTPRVLKSDAHDDAYYADLWETIRAGEVWEGEITDCRKSGEHYHAEQTIAPVMDETGTIDHFIAIQTDVTERKERQETLELFRQLVDHSTDGFFVIDPKTSEIVDVNDTACQQLGYERDELLSLSVPDINPDFSADMWDGFVDRVRSEGSWTVEGTHLEKDGSTHPVEVEVAYVSLEEDYHVATTRDITERKRRDRELGVARERYKTLVEAAPDPIFVADFETGRIVEANTAAERIRNQSREEIVGLHFTDLHPEGDADRYRELFVSASPRTEPVHQFDDGSPVLLVTNDGDRIPVSISAGTVTLEDRTLIHGVFRDVSDRIRYEESLHGVNTAARSLLHAETDVEIARTVVDVAEAVLDVTGVCVTSFDDREGTLVPIAYSESLDEVLGEVPSLPPGDSIAWEVFVDQESARFDDVRDSDDVYDAGTPIRSELIVPLGEHGVLLVGDTTVGAFDGPTVEIVEILAATAEAALDRAERTQALRRRERESQIQATRLERANRLNRQIRTINRTLVRANTREEICRAVCDSLTGLEPFEFAWIGEPNLATDELTVSATAGSGVDYLSDVSLALDADRTDPAVRTARERETTVEPVIAEMVHGGEWRTAALLNDFRSAISVPLLHDDILHGVLTIYSVRAEYFDELTTAVVTELGSLIGYALSAVERRSALLGGGSVSLTVEIAEYTDAFVDVAARMETALVVEHVVVRGDDRYLMHVSAAVDDPQPVLDVADELDAIESIRAIPGTDPQRFEVRWVGECIATTIADFGATLRSIEATDAGCRLSLSVPRDQNLRSFVAHLDERYSAVELIAQQDRSSGLSPASDTEIATTPLTNTATTREGPGASSLTERQREILSTAYYSGYFEQPRLTSGVEVADSIGISQPSLSKQLRTGVAKVVESHFESHAESTDRRR